PSTQGWRAIGAGRRGARLGPHRAPRARGPCRLRGRQRSRLRRGSARDDPGAPKHPRTHAARQTACCGSYRTLGSGTGSWRQACKSPTDGKGKLAATTRALRITRPEIAENRCGAVAIYNTVEGGIAHELVPQHAHRQPLQGNAGQGPLLRYLVRQPGLVIALDPE